MRKNVTRITGCLHECICKCMMSCLVLRRMSCSRKICRENQNIYFMFMSSPPPPEVRAVYEITWPNNAEPSRPQMTIWHMRIACRITKATNTHSEYVILTALSRQQWLRERARTIRCTYIACLLYFIASPFL